MGKTETMILNVPIDIILVAIFDNLFITLKFYKIKSMTESLTKQKDFQSKVNRPLANM